MKPQNYRNNYFHSQQTLIPCFVLNQQCTTSRRQRKKFLTKFYYISRTYPPPS